MKNRTSNLGLTWLLLSLLFLVGSVSADWNILKQRNKGSGLGSSSSSSSLKSYCESWRVNVEVNNIKGFEVVPQECIQFIKKYMTSSQYRSDCERAMEEVKLYVASCCSSFKNDGKDAWIFDVDDTLLSTIPFYQKHDYGGQKVNASSLEAWMRESKAPALEHTLKLFHEMKDKGLKLLLISSRRESLRDSTVDNLIKAGYHGWTTLSLRGLDDEYLEVEKYKSKVRKELIKQGYRIWGIVGDQWSSFEGLPKPKRTFKLPNSMYCLS